MTARAAVLIALVASLLAGVALGVALHRPYPLVCGDRFTDARTGQSVPMYVPCSEHRP